MANKMDSYVAEFLSEHPGTRVEVCGSKMKERVYVNVYYQDENGNEKKRTKYASYERVDKNDIFLSFVMRHPNIHVSMLKPSGSSDIILGLKNLVTGEEVSEHAMVVPYMPEEAKNGSIRWTMQSLYAELY